MNEYGRNNRIITNWLAKRQVLCFNWISVDFDFIDKNCVVEQAIRCLKLRACKNMKYSRRLVRIRISI